MAQPQFGPCPPRFVELKKEIAAAYPDFEAGVTKAWREIPAELEKVTGEIARKGSQVGVSMGAQCVRHVSLTSETRYQGVPEVRFEELSSLSEDRVAEIRRKGCMVIRDVVEDDEARTWQAWLREYVSKNEVDGKHRRPSRRGRDLTSGFIQAFR